MQINIFIPIWVLWLASALVELGAVLYVMNLYKKTLERLAMVENQNKELRKEEVKLPIPPAKIDKRTNAYKYSVVNKSPTPNAQVDYSAITYKGKTQSLQAWSIELGRTYQTMWARMKAGNKNVDEIFGSIIAKNNK